jgi:hypothetical protein
VSRIHGRNGMVYLGITGPGGGAATTTAVASPLAFVSDYTINFTVAKVDVTALGDQNLTWVSGLPDASGDFTGFYDTATAQTYVAATDGLSRNFYLYPSLSGDGGADVNEYFYGTILPDFAVAGGVSSAVTMKSTWNAASIVQKYPSLGIPGS